LLVFFTHILTCLRKILYLILFITSCAVASDDMIHLVHADKTSGRLINNERIKIFSGNVEVYQDTLQMFCDEVLIYEDSDRTDFIGNVIFHDGNRRLWADKVVYYTKEKIAHCYGSVKISRETDSLFTKKLIYWFRTKNAEAENNLYIWDKQNNSHIWGDSGTFLAEKRENHIIGNCRFENRNKDKKDTLIITSNKMTHYGLEPGRAVATDGVDMRKGTLRAICDSAVYFMNSEIVWLRSNPFAWQKDMEMKGEKIDLQLDSLTIKKITINEKAQLKSLADSVEKKYNILKGNSIHIFVEENEPDIITAEKNASSIYYIVDEDSIKQGINSASSDTIRIFFKEGEVDSISILGGVEGIFYPPDYKGEIESEE
jgi:lipopolysaccharide export system protein LptA